jgi:glycosyltransferase involved in cell wall biosynthesis
MRILHVEAGRHLYGGARQVLYLLEGLQQRGIESFLAAPTGSAIAAAARPHAQGVHPTTMRGDLDAGMTWRLWRLIRELRPDLVHVHSRRGADVYAGLAAGLARTPAVISRRVDNPESRRAVAAKYRLYAKVIAISEGIRTVLLEQGLGPDRVVCVHSAIRAGDYQASGDRDAARRALGVAPGATVAGMIAQMIPRKGHRHLLAALPPVLGRHPRLEVVLFGQGPLQATLAQEVQRNGLASRVHFAGFRDDLPALLPGLDFVVHPAEMEGLGVSLLQAGAAGLPLIGTRAGGIPEIVVDGVTGLLVEPGDVDGLAAALDRMAAEPALRRLLGQGARHHVTRGFDVSAMVEGNLAVYRAVLGGPAPA